MRLAGWDRDADGVGAADAGCLTDDRRLQDDRCRLHGGPNCPTLAAVDEGISSLGNCAHP
jgi:hypothetical protein